MKVPILIPNIFNHPFTYEDNNKNLLEGDYVKVPFGSSFVTGVVWNNFEKTEKIFKLKLVKEKLDVPKMKNSLIEFINWFSLYNIVPLGMSLRLTLFNKSIVENLEEHNYKNFKLFIKPKKFWLNDEQKKSLLEMKKKGANFNVHVLDGVTGSGKTLVYFSRVKELIDEGFQALIMLPEIGLTSQFQKRFFEYFGFQAAIWHSGISKKNKKIIWRGILEK